MRFAVRLLIALPALAALGWAGMATYDVARADRLVREASAEMASWESRGARPDAGTWQVVRERLDAAERIVATDPTMHELRGLLGSMRVDSGEEMALGIGHLTRALELRPASPYTWANLAEAQYRRGEPGANLELAL